MNGRMGFLMRLIQQIRHISWAGTQCVPRLPGLGPTWAREGYIAFMDPSTRMAGSLQIPTGSLTIFSGTVIHKWAYVMLKHLNHSRIAVKWFCRSSFQCRPTTRFWFSGKMDVRFVKNTIPIYICEFQPPDTPYAIRWRKQASRRVDSVHRTDLQFLATNFVA